MIAAACSTGGKPAAATDTAAPATAAGDTTHAMGTMAHDADHSAAGAVGVPAGYVGRTDREGADIAGAKYASACRGAGRPSPTTSRSLGTSSPCSAASTSR
jgi:hypothetical protein